jgi:hypothetical protein
LPSSESWPTTATPIAATIAAMPAGAPGCGTPAPAPHTARQRQGRTLSPDGHARRPTPALPVFKGSAPPRCPAGCTSTTCTDHIPLSPDNHRSAGSP